MLPISNLIPLTALLPLGTEAQAQAVLSAGSVGNTLLALEHVYGGVSFGDHYEVKTRLEELGTMFRGYVSESSVAFLSTYVLVDFFQKKRLFPQEGNFPLTLTDLLLGNRTRPRPANQATSLIGVAAHLGGLVGISFLLRRNVSGEASLYDPSRGIILDFPSGKAEMQVAPADEGGEPLIALVSFHLAGLADAVSDVDQAVRMSRAARMVYSV